MNGRCQVAAQISSHLQNFLLLGEVDQQRGGTENFRFKFFLPAKTRNVRLKDRGPSQKFRTVGAGLLPSATKVTPPRPFRF